MFFSPEPPAGAGNLEDLRPVTAELARAAAPIEDLSLRIGTMLGGAVEALDRTADAFRDLSRRLDGDEVGEQAGILEAAAARITGLADAERTGGNELGEIAALAAAMPLHLQRLSKIIAGVKVLAVNARVEAAGIAARGEDFSVFTREIGRLAEVAGRELGAVGAAVRTLAGLLDVAAAEREAFLRTHGGSLASVGASIGDSLAALAGRRRDAARAMEDAGARSAQARARVAEAVRALQIGDITRQRIEHACHALDFLEDGIRLELTPDEGELLVGMMCRLQAAQLAHAADELTDETAKLGSSLRALAAESRALADQGANILGGTGGGDSYLDELKRKLQTADDLLRVYAAARSAAVESVERASATVAEMVHHVEAMRSIEVDMRIMGLNATFKCGRLGAGGRALSVIAQELRASSTQTVEAAGTLMELLDRAIGLAAGLSGRIRADSVGSGLSELVASMAAAAAHLGDAALGARSGLGALEADAGAAHRLIGEATALIDTMARIETALRAQASTLLARAAALPADAPELEKVKGRVMDLLESRYTMASEREIHKLFTGEDPAAPATSAAPSEVCVDDLLF